MSIKAVKGFVWLAVAIAVAMIMATASPAFDRNQSLALFLGACGVLVAATLWYYRVIPAAEAREAEDHAAQVAMIKQEISTTGQPKSIKTSNGILLFAFMAAITFWFGQQALARPNPGSIGVFAVSLLLTLFCGLWSLPLVGKPSLIVRHDGVETPILGFFPWDAIESVGLRAYSNKGITSHVLHLFVPRLSEYAARLHPIVRLRHRMMRGAQSDVLTIPLNFASLPGPVVHALCYELWRERTGRTSASGIAPSKELIAFKQRADEQLEMLERVGTLAKEDPAEAMRLLEELKKKFPTDAPPSPERGARGATKTRMDAMMAEMRTIDPRDDVARKRVMDKHVRAEVRRRTAIGTVLIIVGFALVMTVAVLMNR